MTPIIKISCFIIQANITPPIISLATSIQKSPIFFAIGCLFTGFASVGSSVCSTVPTGLYVCHVCLSYRLQIYELSQKSPNISGLFCTRPIKGYCHYSPWCVRWQWQVQGSDGEQYVSHYFKVPPDRLPSYQALPVLQVH